MVFPSVQFLIFFVVVFAIGILCKRNVGLFKIYLLAASLVFYAAWSTDFLALLIANIVINFVLNRAILKSHKKGYLILAISINIIFLGIFKYFNFFADSLYNLFQTIGIGFTPAAIYLIAPLGISFYTFKNISHIVDVYKQKLTQFTFIDFANYVSFFPQIAAGPIERADTFYEDLNKKNKSDYDRGEAIGLFMFGLFKKYTISSFLFTVVTQPFASPLNYTSLELFVAVIGYSALIYVDFSGYVDMANAISMMLGFRKVENFNLPYSSNSINEFWRRWHITLSNWFRDYLYIPLGGNRKGPIRKYINLMIVMLTSGLWHGAGINFIIWGGLHGIGMIVGDILSQVFSSETKIKAMKFITIPITFLTVSFLWIFFNTSTLQEALNYFNQMFSLTDLNSSGQEITSQIVNPLVIAVIVFVLILNFTENKLKARIYKVLNINILLTILLVIVAGFLIVNFGPEQLPAFIYFNF